MADFEIKVRESRRESGQYIHVLAVAPSRRIVATVDLIVPLEPGFSLNEAVGPEIEKELLESAKDLAGRLAAALERPAGTGLR